MALATDSHRTFGDGLLSHFAVFNQGWLWVDAISISQNDAIEKAQQVARMGKIFGGAERVVVWLGEAAEDSDVVFDQMEEVASMVVDGDISDASRAKIARSSAFLAVKLEYWEAAYHLFRRGWFARLWIVQEAIVAQELVMLCGKKCVPWSLMRLLCVLVFTVAEVGKSYNGEVIFGNEEDLKQLYLNAGLVFSIEYRRDARSRHAPPVEDTPSVVLFLAANAETLEPIDRIYALLSIMHPYFQERIVIDYSLSSRNRYWKVYARFISAGEFYRPNA